MEIELTEEQLLLRDTVRRFAAEVVAPRAKEIDASVVHEKILAA